jgi:hypothetical protein
MGNFKVLGAILWIFLELGTFLELLLKFQGLNYEITNCGLILEKPRGFSTKFLGFIEITNFRNCFCKGNTHRLSPRGRGPCLAWSIMDRLWTGDLSDVDITLLDTNNNPLLNVQRPITRARQWNLEVSSFLNSSSYDYENKLLPNDYIVIRDHGEGKGILGEGLGDMEDQQEGGPNQLTSGLFLGSRSSLR